MMIRVAVGITAVLVLGAVAFCTWGDEFLRVEPGLPAERVDAVVVLAGPPEEDRERVLVAVDLVQAGEAGVLLLLLAALGLGWLCLLGPLSGRLEESLLRLASGLPSLTPTSSPTIICLPPHSITAP